MRSSSHTLVNMWTKYKIPNFPPVSVAFTKDNSNSTYNGSPEFAIKHLLHIQLSTDGLLRDYLSYSAASAPESSRVGVRS